MKNAVRLNTMVLLAAVVVFGIFAPMEPAMAEPARCANGDPGLTPLLFAAYNGDIAGVRRLLATGADINATDDRGTTALMCAVIGQASATAKLLIDKGAAINAKDTRGWTALMYDLALNGLHTVGTASRLLAKGADADVVASDGETALMLAARNFSYRELIAKSKNVINATNDHGKTALMIALESGRSCDFIVSLLHHGATIDAASKYGTLALARFLNIDIIPEQLETCSDSGLSSPERHEFIRYFLARGANLGYISNFVVWPVRVVGPTGHVNSKASNRFSDFASPDGQAPMGLREIIHLAGKMDPPPAIPEEAKRHFQMGITAAEDAQHTNDFGEAAGQFLKAVWWAPYWAEPYLNLGLMFEQTKDYGAAVAAFKLYLDADPGARDADAVRKHIWTDEERSRERWKGT